MPLTKEPAEKNSNNCFIYYTASARNAFKAILNSINFSDGSILLPSYIGITDTEGSGVFDPVRETRVNYNFYKVSSDLSFDYEDIIEKIEQNKIVAILVIHYFGFLQKNIKRLGDLCKAKKIVLIEDCAHTMDMVINRKEPQYARQTGDFAFYSIHKYLPTKDGGFFTYKPQDNDINMQFSFTPVSLETLYQTCISDYRLIRKKRISNYATFLKLLNPNSKYSIMHPSLNEDIVPLAFPMLIHNNKRETVYFKLIENKIPVFSLYYRLIEEISRELYPISYTISNSILHFPIHQDISDAEIKLMVDTFHIAINEI